MNDLNPKFLTIMKKLLLIVVVATISMPGMAQTKFGVKASYLKPVYGFFHPDEPGYQSNGVALGIGVNQSLNDNVSLQGELLLGVYNFNIDPQHWYSNMHYLELPIFVKYQWNSGINVLGGIKFGFLMDAFGNWFPNSNFVAGGIVQSEITKDDFSGANISFPVGVGYLFGFGGFVDAKFNVGLNNINSSDKDFFIERVSSAELSVGYWF